MLQKAVLITIVKNIGLQRTQSVTFVKDLVHDDIGSQQGELKGVSKGVF
ncbi:hypothetical protein ACMV8I_04015 [Ewingella sp. S1.OA.A_B6]